MANPDFEPEYRIITNITNAQNAAVTTAVAHGYINNSTVCLIVPNDYGMHLDYVETKITVTGLTTFTCDLDTFSMDPFVIPAVVTTPAHVCPVTQKIDNVAV